MAAERGAVHRSTAELERFLAERADHLLRTAALLTGSRDAGEELLQTAVERLLRRWHRFDGDPEGYLRRTLCNLAIDGSRRAGRICAMPWSGCCGSCRRGSGRYWCCGTGNS